ncbi:hypothetical protein CLAFUW4_11493 [Fulvia fulva]|uniref:Uncharacterized protein n=1 Tax=Passalora fulva TaxID=5499 RepID=A0A9Q8URX9_PASFU|nr:uncharacterized protein CLAFUR5_10537 [Fulvia fulva]KAK4620203.1 hypothetical protein CLAFUR4_11499 [Fulvia fulva]KAK4620353.1 hypothetical protein CLAFUR0_11507 [Fulvia fulva]UJO20200.1 hypothetical protein CLAFUR5_10537 [Fulvia fulva]WPV17535.1 hypothetical protein CLAFUW4_11493 [Fulvia fulva]WPV31866.1 hypothetical protein CLAFUW7_11498 [Fulvia fulva]
MALVALKVKGATHGFIDLEDKTGEQRAIVLKLTKHAVTVIKSSHEERGLRKLTSWSRMRATVFYQELSVKPKGKVKKCAFNIEAS